MKNRKRIKKGRGRHGMTLVELVVTAGLLATVLSAMAMIGTSSDRAYRNGAVSSQLESRISITIDRIVDELSKAAIETIDPDPGEAGSSEIAYVQAVGFEDGEVQWTGRRRLALEYELGEIDDGLDNNQNGLIDERRIVLTIDEGEPTELRTALTRWVPELMTGEFENGLDDNGDGTPDEPGFHLSRSGTTVTISLALERLDAEGRIMTRMARTSVKLRN